MSAKDRDIFDRRDVMTGSIAAAGAAVILGGKARAANAQQKLETGVSSGVGTVYKVK